MTTPAPALLELEHVSKTFAPRRHAPVVHAVADVSFEVGAGESVGLIGSSGAGKSTIARMVAGLLTPDSGVIRFEGCDLAGISGAARRAVRRRVHLIFQDPYTSLAPRMRVTRAVAEPLAIHRAAGAGERRELALAALATVGLEPCQSYADRWPHELSGGERQRVALARALVLRPALIVADEPTGMLDASARLDLHRLMADLRREHGLAYLYVTHDLALADSFCDRIVVLHEGRLVEEGPTDEVLRAPSHPWTAALVRAALELQPPDLR